MQWDYRTAFSSTQNEKLQTRPYKDLGEIMETFPTLKPKHALAVMDDPPPHHHDSFRSTINHLFCNGRHKGYSPILCCQEVGFLAKDKMGYVKSNAHLFIFPTNETRTMLNGLRQHGIVTQEQAQLLHTNANQYMYNVVDKKRGNIYLLDRQGSKSSQTLKDQLQLYG